MFQLTARADQVIYDDALENGWVNWSWATVNLANTSPVHSGFGLISVTASNTASNWQALYLSVSAMNTSGFSNLTFWINGGTGGQAVLVQGILGGTAQTPGVQIGAAADQFLAAGHFVPVRPRGGQPGKFHRLLASGRRSSAIPTFYVDDISLITNAVTGGTNSPVSIAIAASSNRIPISPLIYGVAFATM